MLPTKNNHVNPKATTLPAKIRKDLCIDEIQELLNAHPQDYEGHTAFIYIKKSGSCMKLKPSCLVFQIPFAFDWDIMLRFEHFAKHLFSVSVKSQSMLQTKSGHRITDDGFRLMGPVSCWIDLWLLFNLSGDWLAKQQDRLRRCCVVVSPKYGS